MWNLVKLKLNGDWEELGSFETLENAKSQTSLLNEEKDSLFYFWGAEMPSDKIEQEKIANEVFDVNEGKVIRLTLGLDFSPSSNKEALSKCGRCFCVITPDKRRCEGSYCNADGVCWWVDCGSGC